MRILWIKTDFLHPTTSGGRIRTLAMLRRLHRNHEIHYVAFDDPQHPEGCERAGEYSTNSYPVAHFVPDKASWAFVQQVTRGLVSPVPVVVSRYMSSAMRARVAELMGRLEFDAIVCDFLFSTANVPDLARAILFQHNVESTIWRRHRDNARTILHRWFFELQWRRMEAYEKSMCRKVRRVIAVSPTDADVFASHYGVTDVKTIATGVDVDYFTEPLESTAPPADIIFLGSMDWMPNIDGVRWFVDDVLPLIHAKRAHTTIAIVGRKPSNTIMALAERDPRIRVTGTVPDVRPWMRAATVSVVPLRIGGGTRLKIYEAMAARVPVISTTIGAEGLDVTDGLNIRIGDTPMQLAAHCLDLLDNEPQRRKLTTAAFDMTSSRYGWDVVSDDFARLLVT